MGLPRPGIDAENDIDTPWSEVSDAVTVDQTAPAAPSLAPGRDPEFAGDGGWWKDSVDVHTSDNGDPDLRDGSTPSGVDPSTVAGPRLLEESATLARTVATASATSPRRPSAPTRSTPAGRSWTSCAPRRCCCTAPVS